MRAIHWISAALIAGMIGLGLYMTHADIEVGEAFDLYQWHKSFGFVALALTLIRIAVRARIDRPPFPTQMRRSEVILAKLAHGLFYALLIALPLIGWVMVSASLLPVPTVLFGLVEIPPIAAPNERLCEIARTTHRFAAWTLAALIVMHIAAALKHHWLDRDMTLRRMLFGRGSRG